MKQFHLKSIKEILSKSINKQGVSLDLLYKQHPYEISFDLYELLIAKDSMIDATNLSMIKLKDDYYKTDSYVKFEESYYNINYLKTLFKEETNTIKLSILKLLVDSESLTYQQIANEMKRLNDVKLDIKQVSHYCMELVKIKLILSNQSNTIEKINRMNHVSAVYNKKLVNSNTNDNDQSVSMIRRNIQFNPVFSHYPKRLLNFDLNEIQSENKFYISNRYRFVIDECEIKNNILFHLIINRETGLTGNEICLLCDFAGREKTLNKIITSLETKKVISHSVVREGKKMEYVYKIIDGVHIDKKIAYYAEYYRNHTHSSFNNNCMTDANRINAPSINSNQNNKNDFSKRDSGDMLVDSNDLNPSLLSNIINSEYEDLNQSDFEYILSITSNDINSSYSQKEKCKIISSYINGSEANRYFSMSTYNRFVFILNQINEKKILSLIDIKHLIMHILELNKGYEIDRKTLKRILENLAKKKLIKLVYLDLIMKNLKQTYLNHKEEIKQEKIVALRRDQDENDEELIHEISEKAKPPKKNLIQKPKKKEVMKNEKKSIDLMIENLTKDQHVIIAQNEMNVNILVKKLLKYIKEQNNKDLKAKFILKMKRLYSIKKNATIMFDNKEYSSTYNSEKMKMSSLLEEVGQRNIIIPQYQINNVIKENGINDEDDYSIMKDYYDFVLKSKKIIKETLQSSYCNNYSHDNVYDESGSINKDETKDDNNETATFLHRKRNNSNNNDNDESYPEIAKTRFELKKWNKLIDVYVLLKEIYFLPGITYKKLKRIIHLSNDVDGAETELLQFLQKLHIIKITNKDCNDYSIIDSTSLNVDRNFKLFIDI